LSGRFASKFDGVLVDHIHGLDRRIYPGGSHFFRDCIFNGIFYGSRVEIRAVMEFDAFAKMKDPLRLIFIRFPGGRKPWADLLLAARPVVEGKRFIHMI